MAHAAYLNDPFSAWSHLAGAMLAALGLAVLVVLAAVQASAWHSERGIRLLRRLDHIMIYLLLIAGTYTSVCLLPLRDPWGGYGLLASVWGLALAGALFKLC